MCTLVTENGASSLQKKLEPCHWLVRCLVKVQANNKPSAKPTVAYYVQITQYSNTVYTGIIAWECLNILYKEISAFTFKL